MIHETPPGTRPAEGPPRPERDGGRSVPVGHAAVLVTTRRAEQVSAGDVLLGLGAGAATLAWRASAPVRWVSGIALAAASAAVPSSVTAALADRGRQVRGGIEVLTREVLLLVVPPVIRSVLATLDLTELVREHVDLDRVAAGLDVAAVIDRVDLDAVVSRVDLEAAVDRVDLDAVVRKVDLDAVVSRVDLDAVAGRLDLDPLVAKVNVQAVLDRVDLVRIAEEVITAIDLPEILRQSSGAVASEAVRGVRSGGMQADDAVTRFVDRLLRRGAGPTGSATP